MKKIFSLLLLSIVFCACAPAQTPTPLAAPATQAAQTQPSAQTPVQLTYWHALTGVSGSAQDDLAQEFNASQTAIQVTSEFQGSFYTEIEEKVLIAYAGGDAPEVSQIGTYQIREYARAGMLVDLTPYIQGENGLSTADFPEKILAAGKVGDGIYWLPFNIAVPVLYYNQEAFQEAGLTQPPQTWDEFYDYTRRLTVRDENGAVQRAGTALWDMSWAMLSAIWSEGGDLTDAEYHNITLNDPQAVKVLSRFQDLVKEGAAVLPDKASGGHRGAFKNGQAAMILDSPSPFNEIYEQAVGFTPAVANYPAGARGKVYAPGAGGLVMLSTTPPEKRAAAWSFIKFMLSPKSLGSYTRQTSYIAYYPAAQQEVGDLLKDERYATIYAAVPHVRWDFALYNAPPVRDGFEKAWQKIFFDLADVQKTLDEANTEAKNAWAN